MKCKSRYCVPLLLSILIAGCTTISLKDAKKIAISNNAPILITELRTGYPNSAAGVNLYVNFINLSQKAIKYADITVVAINRVGDPVYGQIRRRRTRTVQCMGPVNPDTQWHSVFNSTWFENIWYSRNINSLKLETVNITYMDGTTEEISESARLDVMIAK
ncbi:MAG: hypothetical protein SCARUB_01866 [Candidatus Scalindua rubra]|uniref:Lipoprotein n=1 Tax=Candidatus Scalindua rubra TaxID=1872076 RepID=A0A1E3XBL1_9BACT|nr:MAG: hypothetical protein SCARUB_01866 [Candidatus Scalindua rubra]